jgi:CSLREA domain-containing protein
VEVAVVLAALCAGAAEGATITVTSTGDDTTLNGNCTLREAVTAANKEILP